MIKMEEDGRLDIVQDLLLDLIKDEKGKKVFEDNIYIATKDDEYIYAIQFMRKKND